MFGFGKKKVTKPQDTDNNMVKILDTPKEQIAPKVEQLPTKYAERVQKLKKDKNTYFNEFLSASVRVTELQQKQQVLLEKIKNNEEALKRELKTAFQRLQLDKQVGYIWRFDGETAFLGILKKQPPKEEPKQ